MVAQGIGRTIALCEEDVGHHAALDTCKRCIESNSSNGSEMCRQNCINSFLDSCDSLGATTLQLPTGTVKPSIDTPIQLTSEATGLSNAANFPFVYTNSESGLATLLIPETYFPRRLDQDGRCDKCTIPRPSRTPQPTSPSPTPKPKASTEQAWITGKVFGGVAGIGVLLRPGIWLHRQRQK